MGELPPTGPPNNGAEDETIYGSKPQGRYGMRIDLQSPNVGPDPKVSLDTGVEICYHQFAVQLSTGYGNPSPVFANVKIPIRMNIGARRIRHAFILSQENSKTITIIPSQEELVASYLTNGNCGRDKPTTTSKLPVPVIDGTWSFLGLANFKWVAVGTPGKMSRDEL